MSDDDELTMTERYRRHRSNPAPLPHVTVVMVSTATRHGRTGLHTFAQEGNGEWSFVTPPSSRQAGEFMGAFLRSRRGGTTPAPPAPLGALEWGQGIAGQHLDLGDGLSVQGSTLSVVFDALAATGRQDVDRGDLKVVLSQLGHAIVRLESLGDDETRRQATGALYAEIVRRCTRV